MPGWALFRGLILSIMKSVFVCMCVCWVDVLDTLGVGCVWMYVCCVHVLGCVWLCMHELGRSIGCV